MVCRRVTETLAMLVSFSLSLSSSLFHIPRVITVISLSLISLFTRLAQLKEIKDEVKKENNKRAEGRKRNNWKEKAQTGNPECCNNMWKKTRK